MPITPDELSLRYPRLYHMGAYGAWPLIRQHGLLSSRKLAELFGVPAGEQSALLLEQRRQGIVLRHPEHGTATLRDQKPLSHKALQGCLTGCTPEQWFHTLNDRVFFWLCQARLTTLMSAKSYAGHLHTVLHVDTAALLRHYADRIELAPMNTGSTSRFAHPRGPHTFQPLSSYPFAERRKYGQYGAIVELTIPQSVPDIRDFVVRVEHAAQWTNGYEVQEVLYER